MRRISSKAALWRELDRLARQLVVEIRDKNTCQRCGNCSPVKQIHWAHVYGRRAKSIQWAPWNSLALCAGCHRWFDEERERGRRWWAQKWPDRAFKLETWRASRPPKVDLGLERIWLVSAIRGEGG